MEKINEKEIQYYGLRRDHGECLIQRPHFTAEEPEARLSNDHTPLLPSPFPKQ